MSIGQFTPSAGESFFVARIPVTINRFFLLRSLSDMTGFIRSKEGRQICPIIILCASRSRSLSDGGLTKIFLALLSFGINPTGFFVSGLSNLHSMVWRLAQELRKTRVIKIRIRMESFLLFRSLSNNLKLRRHFLFSFTASTPSEDKSPTACHFRACTSSRSVIRFPFFWFNVSGMNRRL